MTNQELNDLLARFEGSSLSKLKLSTQEFTIEMERAVSAPAAPVLPAAAAAPAVPAAAEPEVMKENGALVSFGEPLFRYQPC